MPPAVTIDVSFQIERIEVGGDYPQTQRGVLAKILGQRHKEQGREPFPRKVASRNFSIRRVVVIDVECRNSQRTIRRRVSALRLDSRKRWTYRLRMKYSGKGIIPDSESF